MTKLSALACALLLIPMAAMAAMAPTAAAPANWSPPILTTEAPVFSFSTLSDCTANCADGTTRVCSGSQCYAQDSICPATARGYCWSDVEGYKYCPDCVCRAPSCDDLDGQACTSGHVCSQVINGTCRKFSCSCTNNQYLCP